MYNPEQPRDEHGRWVDTGGDHKGLTGTQTVALIAGGALVLGVAAPVVAQKTTGYLLKRETQAYFGEVLENVVRGIS